MGTEIVIAVAAVFSLLATVYFSRSEDAHRRREYKDRVLNERIDARFHHVLKDSGLSTLPDRMARLEVTVDIYTRAVALDAARALHSPHIEMSRRDYLLERLLAGDINPAEQGELYRMLYGSAFGPFTEGLPAGERVAASLVLRLLESMDEEDRNAQERLHTLDQPTMSSALVVVDDAIVSWSGDVAGVLGHDPGELEGQSISLVLPTWDQLEDSALNGVPYHRTVTDAAGRDRPVWVTLSNQPDSSVTVRIETRDPDATLAESPLH